MQANSLTNNLQQHVKVHTCQVLHSKGIHVKFQGDSIHKQQGDNIHKQGSKWKGIAQGVSNAPTSLQRLIQAMYSTRSTPLHEHCHNLGVPKTTPSLHANILTSMCCLGPNALLWDAKCSSS